MLSENTSGWLQLNFKKISHRCWQRQAFLDVRPCRPADIYWNSGRLYWFWSPERLSLDFSTLIVETLRSSEMFATIYHSTQHHIKEGVHPYWRMRPWTRNFVWSSVDAQHIKRRCSPFYSIWSSTTVPTACLQKCYLLEHINPFHVPPNCFSKRASSQKRRPSSDTRRNIVL